jgi:hypothetical protein
MSLVKCPTCKRLIEYSPDNKWRPFCSERCKLIDLGQWAAEKHAIPVESVDEETREFGHPDAEHKP